MSSINELKNVLKEALENKGIANEIKAKLRSEIFTILDDNTFEKPRISQENLLINELIREYMEFNNYNFSKSVFLKETNQPSVPINREIISTELQIKEDRTTRQVPLLYSLIWNRLNDDESDIQEKDNKTQLQHKAAKNKDPRSQIQIYRFDNDNDNINY